MELGRKAALIALFAILSPFAGKKALRAESAEAAVYGKPFDYGTGGQLSFADFDLRFAGNKPGAVYPGTSRKLADVLQFEITGGGIKQTISWSSGAGDIGPTYFKTAEKCFQLEILYSEKLHKLAPGQAVVSVAPLEYCR